MKVQKASRIGVVVSDDALRAVQQLDGRWISAQVPCGDGDLTRTLRKLLSSSPFAGRKVVVGLEGAAVLVESLAVPPGATRPAEAICTERLTGDPLFNAESAALGVAVSPSTAHPGPGLIVLAAVRKARIAEVMQACRETQLEVHAVEAAALAAWRAWPSTGVHLRLLRGACQDVLQAGVDGRLLFCRVVTGQMAMPELRATITRAAALLGQRFASLTVSGRLDPALASLCRELGLELAEPSEPLADPWAAGLSRDGVRLTEFTPPEELTLRARRRVRKTRFAMITASGALLLLSGVLGFQRLSGLRTTEMALQTELRNRQSADEELNALRGKLAALQERDRRVTDAVPSHLGSSVWALLLNEAPAGLHIESLLVEDKEETDGAGARFLAIKVSGLAVDGAIVRTYADRLLASGGLSDVRVETSETVLLDGGHEGERFRIAARAETR